MRPRSKEKKEGVPAYRYPFKTLTHIMKPDAYFFSGAFFSSAFGAGAASFLGASFLASFLGSPFFLSAFFLSAFLASFLGSAFLSSAFFSGAGAASFFSGAFAGAAWAKHRPVVATTNIMANRIASTFFICCHLLPVCLVLTLYKDRARCLI